MRAFYLRLMAGLSVSVLKVLAGIIFAGEELNDSLLWRFALLQ
jgi:hypothetical protein